LDIPLTEQPMLELEQELLVHLKIIGLVLQVIQEVMVLVLLKQLLQHGVVIEKLLQMLVKFQVIGNVLLHHDYSEWLLYILSIIILNVLEINFFIQLLEITKI